MSINLDGLATNEPIRAVLEALGIRLGELEARARTAEQRAVDTEFNYQSVHRRYFDEQKKVERLEGERDDYRNRMFDVARTHDELRKRIDSAIAILEEHPRSGARALAILRGEELGE